MTDRMPYGSSRGLVDAGNASPEVVLVHGESKW